MTQNENAASPRWELNKLIPLCSHHLSLGRAEHGQLVEELGGAGHVLRQLVPEQARFRHELQRRRVVQQRRRLQQLVRPETRTDVNPLFY